ncbi:glycoside hydrolase [Xylariaceae sp. FL0804]|nr:glycoside hydrolase [Xylariaceae sp. FL0804]
MFTRALTLLPALAAYAPVAASAYEVFAHYMVQGLDSSTDHASQDITTAQAMGLSAFALNVGDPSADWAQDAISQLFDAAAGTGFKLFFSLDMAQEGDAYAFQDLLGAYLGHDSYYRAGSGDGNAFLSTFQSAGNGPDYWSDFLGQLGEDTHFVPMFDETEGYYDDPAGWQSSGWGDVVDGLFSWETAWPGQSDTQCNVSTAQDEAVMAASGGKDYMIGLSGLQYKHWSGNNYFRAGEVTLPERMTEILSLGDRPSFVEVQTWNDAGESHYVGPLWAEGLDDSILAYASEEGWSHAGWRPLLASFIAAYTTGVDATGMRPIAASSGDDDDVVVAGVMWYRALLTGADCTADTYGPPDGAGAARDAVNWAVVAGEGAAGGGYRVQVWSDGVLIRKTTLGAGLNYFSAGGMTTGKQYVEVVDADDNIVISACGAKEVVDTAVDGVCNYNYQVAELS